MTKDDLLKNLRAHQTETETFAWKIGVSGCAAIVLSMLILWLKPFCSIIDPQILVGGLLFAFIVPFLYFSIKHEKINDKEYGMHCKSCSKRRNPATLAIAVLENKCQECGATLYDS